MTCVHLENAPLGAQQVPDKRECQDCVAAGRHDWVHLRLCLECGHMACCDSSPRRHATKHFEECAHPVMRSAEPGEDWRWCFVDNRLG